jgi:tRNA A-37 threonylcarbamoyl transferase component Bud32
MATQADTSGHVLSPEGLDALLRLLVTGEQQRIGSAVVDGRTVWIKRFGAANRSTGKWLHAALTRLAPYGFLRSSPSVDAVGRADREARKTEAFRAAGFPALDILFRGEDVLVFSNAGRIVRDEIARLAATNPAAADKLLIDCAAALGRAHAAGLVHGRPHPRDMFIEGNEIGFLDFEEEPEAVMPLAQAQARDTWLLFQQIAARGQAPETSDKAFAAYQRHAPAQALAELKVLVGFFARLLGPANSLGRLIGSDGRRMVAGTQFLKTALTPAGGGAAGELQENKYD